MGAGDILVGAGSARGPLTWQRSRPVGTSNRSERADSEALKDLVKFESLGFIASDLLRTLLVEVFDTPLLAAGYFINPALKGGQRCKATR